MVNSFSVANSSLLLTRTVCFVFAKCSRLSNRLNVVTANFEVSNLLTHFSFTHDIITITSQICRRISAAEVFLADKNHINERSSQGAGDSMILEDFANTKHTVQVNKKNCLPRNRIRHAWTRHKRLLRHGSKLNPVSAVKGIILLWLSGLAASFYEEGKVSSTI